MSDAPPPNSSMPSASSGGAVVFAWDPALVVAALCPVALGLYALALLVWINIDHDGAASWMSGSPLWIESHCFGGLGGFWSHNAEILAGTVMAAPWFGLPGLLVSIIYALRSPNVRANGAWSSVLTANALLTMPSLVFFLLS